MIALIMALLPAIPHIVTGVEAMFGHGTGALKKQTASGILGDFVNLFTQSSAMTAGSTTPQAGANSQTMAYIDELIDATVEYFNATGTFTHGGTTK